MENITTIIFDFGGVLVKDTVEYFENTHGYKKLSKEQREQHERNIRACELGKISYWQLFERMAKVMGPRLTGEQVEQFILSHTKLLPPYKLINPLRKNYQVLILSNNFKNWPKVMWKAVGATPPVVPFINSAVIGRRKINGEAFGYAAKKFKLNPKQCVFIDDHTYNIKPAKRLGMKTFLYKNNIADLKKYLKKLGIQGL